VHSLRSLPRRLKGWKKRFPNPNTKAAKEEHRKALTWIRDRRQGCLALVASLRAQGLLSAGDLSLLSRALAETEATSPIVCMAVRSFLDDLARVILHKQVPWARDVRRTFAVLCLQSVTVAEGAPSVRADLGPLIAGISTRVRRKSAA
jgi:hypothetical protein